MEQQNNHPHETPSNATSSPHYTTELNARHYQAILKDDAEAFREQGINVSHLTRSSDNSSILHIAASTGQSEDMISFIVQQRPDLLRCPNSKGDLPTHVAVRAGHLNVVRNLVNLANDNSQSLGGYDGNLMLEHGNSEHNSALHVALQNQQEAMADYLFGNCNQIFCRSNLDGISPLFLAIKAGFWDLVLKMLDSSGNYSSEMTSRDELFNYPVLHAAIMAKNQVIVEKIIQRYSDELTYSMDGNGMRPLSYAAYLGFLDGVKCILNMRDEHNENNTLYRNQAFKMDNDGSFPIHGACRGGDIQVVMEMLRTLPETMSWLLNKKGQSILHVAAQSGKFEVVEYLMRQTELGAMINMKDEDGNTPLHLGVIGKHPKVVFHLTLHPKTKFNLQSNHGFTALDLADNYGHVPSFEERLTWLALIYAGVPRAPQQQVPQTNNNEEQVQVDMSHITNGLTLNGETTFSVTQQGELQVRNQPKSHKNKYKERINTLLIISTLISTVTYASGFTVPGGFNNSNPNQGLATLDHTFPFQLYVITNTISLYTSILATVSLIWARLDDVRLVLVSLDVALPLLGIALVSMAVAFMAGSYVVLDDLSWLSLVVLVMGGLFVGVLCLFLMPLFLPTSFVKFRVTRYVSNVLFKLFLLVCVKNK